MRAVVAGDFQRVQVMVGKLAEIERNAGRETPLMVAAHYDEDCAQNGSVVCDSSLCVVVRALIVDL